MPGLGACAPVLSAACASLARTPTTVLCNAQVLVGSASYPSLISSLPVLRDPIHPGGPSLLCAILLLSAPRPPHHAEAAGPWTGNTARPARPSVTFELVTPPSCSACCV